MDMISLISQPNPRIPVDDVVDDLVEEIASAGYSMLV